MSAFTIKSHRIHGNTAYTIASIIGKEYRISTKGRDASGRGVSNPFKVLSSQY